MLYLCNNKTTKVQAENEKQPDRSPTTSLYFYGKGTTFFRFHNKKVYVMKKNRISDILGGISVICVFAGCVEGPDGGLTFWTIICLAAAFCFGLLSKKTEEAK